MAAPTATAVARMRAVSKSYGSGRSRRTVLEHCDFEVAAGEIVAILGRSGSGKSTLLQLLGGLDHADEGEIEVAGVRVDQARERDLLALRRDTIGFVFQFFHLLPELTAEENVLLAARIPGSAPAAPGRARELLGQLELDAVSSSLPHELSGGEQQRIAIARALVHDPAIVLADEPTGNLDPRSGEIVLDLLTEMGRAGRAVVLVTHEQSAAAIADRVVTLDDGVVVDALP